MTTLLHIDVSARNERSISRNLSRQFIEEWQAREPNAQIIRRDLAENVPPLVTEDWIGAVFTPEEGRTEEQRSIVAASDELIGELDRADVIVIGTPMYNYGMPAALKLWTDQVIRVGKTFSFDLARGDYPLEPIMSGKTLVLLSSRGEFGFEPGGIRQDMNFLDGHVFQVGFYLGVEDNDKHLVAVDYQEFDDDRHEQSKVEAVARIPNLVEEISTARATKMAAE